MACVCGMQGGFRLSAVLLFTAWIVLAALNRLLQPVPNGCVMTYMYPTYIPIAAAPRNVSSDRYGLFLYHEGWKQIDFAKHIRGLSGVPVLFIPGNGGSYKQVGKDFLLLHAHFLCAAWFCKSSVHEEQFLSSTDYTGVVEKLST
jgi:hypothetical protein